MPDTIIYDHLNINGSPAMLYAPGVLTGLGQTSELVGIDQEIANIRLGSGWVSPDDYGAVGDGETDDTQAVRIAFETGLNVSFGKNKIYRVTGDIYIRNNQNIDLNNATIVSTVASLFHNYQSTDTTMEYNGNGNFYICNGTIVGGEVLIGHGHDIVLRNVKFRNSLGSHSIQVMSTRRLLIDNCSFAGLTPNLNNSFSESINLDPCSYTAFGGYGEGSVAYDGTPNKDITISNCYFALGDEEGFDSLVNAIGGHYYEAGQYQTDIKIINNVVDGATGSGFRTYGFRHSLIMGNIVRSSSYAVQLGHGEGLLITGNEFIYSGDSANIDRSAILFYYDEDMLSLYDNVFRRYGPWNLNINSNDITFAKTDPVMLSRTQTAPGNDISLSVPYTTFDTLTICIGYISGNNLRTASVRAWPLASVSNEDWDRFVAPAEVGTSDEYPIDLPTDASVILNPDGRTIQVTGAANAIRYVLGSRKTR